MKREVLLYILTLMWVPQSLWSQETPFEKGNGNQTATYEEAIAFYESLASSSPNVHIDTFETGTDIGYPLHLVIITGKGGFNPEQIKQQGKSVILINNAIHPGEPCGVDASMMLARDLATNPQYKSLLGRVAILIVPIYNVGGALNRGCCSRANQIGPEKYGFRGNARNLDLNRDFIKCDSRNTQTFTRIFTAWNPDVFVDTHTTDGADYPYTMTLIPTQKDKIHPVIANYMTETMTPQLYAEMEKSGYEMCPYVNAFNWSNPPDSGLAGYLETPRYSTGYAALFHTIAYVSEAHMLKPFSDRVEATYTFCLNVTLMLNRDRTLIRKLRKQANKESLEQQYFPLRWKLDKTASSPLRFKGYTANYKPSSITGKPRLYYDRNSAYEKEIPYFNNYKAEEVIKKPYAYIIPQAWVGVIQRLKWNGVELHRFKTPASLSVEVYYIDSLETMKTPYEGHYLHRGTRVRRENQTIKCYPGDYIVYPDQRSIRYIVETLEPAAHDSYFNWNFFDEILMRKEYFSPYLFEEEAERLLEAHPEWKAELEELKSGDSDFANSSWQQLNWIYQKSGHYEITHMRYPVYRLIQKQSLLHQ